MNRSNDVQNEYILTLPSQLFSWAVAVTGIAYEVYIHFPDILIRLNTDIHGTENSFAGSDKYLFYHIFPE